MPKCCPCFLFIVKLILNIKPPSYPMNCTSSHGGLMSQMEVWERQAFVIRVNCIIRQLMMSPIVESKNFNAWNLYMNDCFC